MASLFLSTLLMIGIVAISGIAPGEAAPHAAAVESQPDELVLRNPLSEGIITWELTSPGETHEPRQLNLGTFATLVLALGAVGWVLEAVLVSLIVSYVSRLRPDLVRSPA